MAKMNILITAHHESLGDAIRQIFAGQPDIEVATRVLEPSQVDPLQGLAGLPDLMIAVLNSRWEDTLHALAVRPAAQRPAIIVIGPTADPHLMRRAMQIGARDYFAPPVAAADLLQAVRLIGRENGVEAPTALAPMTAVINAKGGSGASFIALNLAHALTTRLREDVALLDLDLQFGSLPLTLDLEQKHSLLDALAASEQLDAVALQGYVSKHASGVHVLSAMADLMPNPGEIKEPAMNRLLSLVRQSYRHVIADLPRQIDTITTAALQQATRVVVVMEQTLPHLHDAKRMVRAIIGNLHVPRDNLVLVVNRYTDKAPVSLDDVQSVTGISRVIVLPSDFRVVSESLNSGVPVLQFAPHAAISKALQSLADALNGGESSAPASNGRHGLRAALAGTFRA